MTVSYEQILKKMLHELQAAQTVVSQEAALKQHMAKIVSLGELILDEQAAKQVHTRQMPIASSITPASTPGTTSSVQSAQLQTDPPDDGTSIFDF